MNKKAWAAIHRYAEHETRKTKLFYLYVVVDKTLEAERMPRARLYQRLEAWGYRWQSRAGVWHSPGGQEE